jgi:hypothetical protein
MRLLLTFVFFVLWGCSSNLSVIDKATSGEGIVILSHIEDKVVVQITSYTSRNYQFFLNEIEKYANKQCDNNYEIYQSKDIIPIIAYECRSGGCDEFPEQSFVFEIKCPNKPLKQDK